MWLHQGFYKSNSSPYRKFPIYHTQKKHNLAPMFKVADAGPKD